MPLLLDIASRKRMSVRYRLALNGRFTSTSRHLARHPRGPWPYQLRVELTDTALTPYFSLTA